jgi:hypothetical protein
MPQPKSGRKRRSGDSDDASRGATLDIDRFGRVGREGSEIFIDTPLVRIPFGVEKYNNNYVLNLELINDPDSDSKTRKFIKRFNAYEAELERQLEGSYIASLRGAANSNVGAKVRTRAMTGTKGTITSEIMHDGQEVGILEIERGDVGRFRLKLAKAWTMTDKITSRETAGGVWVIASGELTEHGGGDAQRDSGSNGSASSSSGGGGGKVSRGGSSERRSGKSRGSRSSWRR